MSDEAGIAAPDEIEVVLHLAHKAVKTLHGRVPPGFDANASTSTA